MTVQEFYEQLRDALTKEGFVVKSHRNKKGDYLLRLDYGQLRDIRIGTKRTYNKILRYNVSEETKYAGEDGQGCMHFPLKLNQIQDIVEVYKSDRRERFYDIGKRKLSTLCESNRGYGIDDKESIVLIAKGKQIYNGMLAYKVKTGYTIRNFK